VVIEEEIPFFGLLPDTLAAKLEECNSETKGRAFRIFVVSEDDRSKYCFPHHPKNLLQTFLLVNNFILPHMNRTLQSILEARGVSPLFGHVFLPVDLSPLQMEDFEQGKLHHPYQDEVAGELEEDEEGKKAKTVKDDLTMEISTATEVIVQVWDSKLTTTIWDNPILHGKGALYSKLGVEPTEWMQKESVRVTRRWVYRGNSIKVFVRVQDITTTLPPPNVKVVCWEVSRREKTPKRAKHRQWPSDNYPEYSEQELKEQERGKGALHAGHHGSELEFGLTNDWDEDDDWESMVFHIDNPENGDGPEFHFIPAFILPSDAPWYLSLSLSLSSITSLFCLCLAATLSVKQNIFLGQSAEMLKS